MSIGTRPAWRELLEIEGYGVDEGSSGGWIKNQQQPPGRGGEVVRELGPSRSFSRCDVAASQRRRMGDGRIHANQRNA